MNEKKTGFELVGEYAELHEDDYEAARALLGDLRVNQKATVALLPVIAWAVGTTRRGVVRSIHRAARRASRKGLGFTHDTVLARKKMLEQVMAMGDGRRIRVGSATVAEHREYIGMLERNVAGLKDTIAHHEELIQQIESAGARIACSNRMLRGGVPPEMFVPQGFAQQAPSPAGFVCSGATSCAAAGEW